MPKDYPFPDQTENLITLANNLADISAKEILPLFRTSLTIEDKAQPGSFDPVTQADKNAEQAIRTKLETMIPDHGIIGEEFGVKEPAKTQGDVYQWVLDPIDGTRGFMSGFPTWGTLIGLLRNSVPFIGLMNQPFTGERYWAWHGAEATSYLGPDGKKHLKTRSCPNLSDAVMSTTAPDMFKTGFQEETYKKIQEQTKLIRYSADCYAYCLLAAGHLDLVLEVGLNIYDIAPLIPIIESAGGIVTTWEGNPATNGGNILACGDPVLHEKVLRQIEGSSDF